MRARRAILTAACCVAGVLAALAVAPSLSYRSTAVLRYADSVLPPDVKTDPYAVRFMAPNVLSRSSLTGLIHTFGLYTGERSLQPLLDVVEKMRSQVRIGDGPENTVEVTFRYHEPAAAQRVTSELASKVIQASEHYRSTLDSFHEQFLRDMTALAAREWDGLTLRVRTSKPDGAGARRLALDLDLARSQYISLREKLAAAELLRKRDQQHLGSKLELLDNASYSGSPEQTRGPFLFIGALAGLGAGCAILWLRFVARWLSGASLKSVAAFALAGLTLAAVAAWIRDHTRTFTSAAVIRIVPDSIPAELVGGATSSRNTVGLAEIGRAVLARGVLINLINSYDLYKDKRNGVSIEQIADGMWNDIAFTPLEHDSLRVEYRHGTPYMAQKIAQDVVSRIVNEFHSQRLFVARSTVRFLHDELNAAASNWEHLLTARNQTAAERSGLDSELARNRYIALKQKLYQATMLLHLDERKQSGTIELVEPASLPVAKSEMPQLLLAGGVAGLVLGLFRRRKENVTPPEAHPSDQPSPHAALGRAQPE